MDRHCLLRTSGRLGLVNASRPCSQRQRIEEAKDLHGRVEDYVNLTSGDEKTKPVRQQEYLRVWSNAWHISAKLTGFRPPKSGFVFQLHHLQLSRD